MIKIKIRNLLKKTACAALSVGIAFSYMPLSSYAMSNNSKRIVDSEVIPIDSIEPGQVFTTGTYEIQKDIEVTQNKPCGNGIEVQGKVKFIFKDNHTVKITAGDAEGMTGGGAGVYVPKDSAFILEGEGKFEVKGGNGAPGSDGRDGVSGRHERSGHWYTYDKMFLGDSGAGGSGGGGAGAGIGTPGGTGGLGGESVSGDGYKTDYQYVGKGGKSGKDGKPGLGAEPSGTFVLWGKIKLDIKGGTTSEGPQRPGSCNSYDYYVDWTGHVFNAPGGAGGGAGGSGFDGACVGSGGAGGSGGGSGAVGCLNGLSWGCSSYGGGGAGGFGKFCGAGGLTWVGSSNDDNGGYIRMRKPEDGHECDGGAGAIWGSQSSCGYRGGDGGGSPKSNTSGAGGEFYFDTMAKQDMRFLKENKGAFSGKEAQCVEFIKESNCKIKTRNESQYVYDGTPHKPEIEVFDKRTEKPISFLTYEIKYFDNIQVGQAKVVARGIKHTIANEPVIVDDNDYATFGTCAGHFIIKYGVKITGIDVKSKVYDGEPVEPIGEPKFTRIDDPSMIVEEKLPVIINYYDKDNNLLKEAPREVGKYLCEAVVDPKEEKYTGSSEYRFEFSIRDIKK